jgi:NADH-quinone oxidoreductase subunit E
VEPAGEDRQQATPMEFSDLGMKEYEDILHHYPSKEAAVKTVLWLAQREFGTLTPEVEKYLSQLMDVPVAHIHGVASFYTMFNKTAVGRYHIQVCHNLSCSLLGAEHIIYFLEEKLDVKSGGTTKDGYFTLSEVECLGSCGTAPMMMVNDTYYENLTPEKIEELIYKLRNGDLKRGNASLKKDKD